MRQEHDKGYRTLLSNPEVFAGLLKSFVQEPWTKRIDPQDLEPVKTSFILPSFERREADIIYKLRDSEEYPPVYFYCLMELQSLVDYSILIRLLFYMVMFWMELLKGIPPEEINRRDFRLPPIIPIVLYNGEGNWTVSREFRSVYAGEWGLFEEYLTNFKYHLIDVNRYSREELVGIGDLMAAVFLMDQKGAPAGTMAYMKELVEKFEAVPDILKNLNRLEGSVFLQWSKGIIADRLPKDGGAAQRKLEGLLKELEEETDVGMFVSNFAVGFSAFLDQYDEDMRGYQRTKEELTRAERERSRAERERSRAERERSQAEREKARVLRLAVTAMREAGLSTEAIAQKTGCSREEIEAMR